VENPSQQQERAFLWGWSFAAKGAGQKEIASSRGARRRRRSCGERGRLFIVVVFSSSLPADSPDLQPDFTSPIHFRRFARRDADPGHERGGTDCGRVYAAQGSSRSGDPDRQRKAGRDAGASASVSADVILFDHDLSPSQQRNIERVLKTRVIDRTQLILDIFARHARTREGQLQVELAQLEYMLPRLAGHGIEMSQLGGGIGTRGPGETQLETDRRRFTGGAACETAD